MAADPKVVPEAVKAELLDAKAGLLVAKVDPAVANVDPVVPAVQMTVHQRSIPLAC